jgi:hypothetical protein
LQWNGTIIIKTENLSNKLVLMKYKLRVFENKVLRRIFGPKRDEV